MTAGSAAQAGGDRRGGRPGAAGRIERLAVGAGVLGLAAVAWFYTVRMALTPGCHSASSVFGGGGAWGGAGFAGAFGMWAVMMAGMMLPTVLPATVALAGLSQGGRAKGSESVFLFVAAYLSVWTAYSALAALAQQGLHDAAFLNPATLSTGPLLGGGVLVVAGAFQWTPWKDACMAKCRSPLGALLAWWRPGPRGALLLGLRFGAYCVGCCWLLMLVCFALGVMNLLWMAAVTLLMLAERVAPWGRAFGRFAGTALAAWGAVLVTGALVG